MKNKRPINTGKTGKIAYKYDFNFITGKEDILTPYCSLCDEFVYNHDHCVFCGCTFEKEAEETKEEVDKINHRIEVTYESVKILQINNSLYTFNNDICVSHATLGKNFEKETLEAMAKDLYETMQKEQTKKEGKNK